MRVRIGPVGEFSDYVFVVVVAFSDDGFVLCRHRDRSTWETPGGHIKPDESPLTAARRELFEETGIVPRALDPVADYDVDGVAGRLFIAEVGQRHPLPGFEMVQTRDVRSLPDDLTYPEITPTLVDIALRSQRQHSPSAQARSL